MVTNKVQIYSVPTLTITKFAFEDVITTSGEENLGGIPTTWKGFGEDFE